MEFREIEISKIKVLENIRQQPTSIDLSELMRSIKQDGLMQPIGVKELRRGKGVEYILLWGYRRMSAYKKLGYKKIPARIFYNKNDKMDEKDFLILNTTENLQRSSISAFELGRIIDFFKQSFHMTNSEIGARLSIPENRVKIAYDTYFKVPEKYRTKIHMMEAGVSRKGKVPLTVANAIGNIKLVTKKQREGIFDWVAKNEVGTDRISKLDSLVSAGVDISSAMKLVDKLKSTCIKLVFNEKELIKLKEKEDKNVSDIVKSAIIKTYGKDLIY